MKPGILNKAITLVELTFVIAISALLLTIVFSALTYYVNLRQSTISANYLSNLRGNVKLALLRVLTRYANYYLYDLRVDSEFSSVCDRTCWESRPVTAGGVQDIWGAIKSELYSSLEQGEDWNYLNNLYHSMSLGIYVPPNGASFLYTTDFSIRTMIVILHVELKSPEGGIAGYDFSFGF